MKPADFKFGHFHISQCSIFLPRLMSCMDYLIYKAHIVISVFELKKQNSLLRFFPPN